MTAKRFNYHYDGFGAYYLCDKEKGAYEDGIMGEIWADKVDIIDLVDLLNKQHETIEQLKQQNKKLQKKIEKERNSFKKTQERYSKEVGAKIKELAKENENTKSVLDDFMWILNVLQANPNDTKRLEVARDMLQNMGVLLYDK